MIWWEKIRISVVACLRARLKPDGTQTDWHVYWKSLGAFYLVLGAYCIVTLVLRVEDDQSYPPLPEALRSNATKNPDLDLHCQVRPISQAPNYFKTNFCSESATARGSNQSVIAFSLFGPTSPRYVLDDVRDNLADIHQHYPGFVVRLYHDRPEWEELCQIFASNDHFDLCYIYSIELGNGIHMGSKFGMMWRFIPMIDPQVTEWHSRDLDSRVSYRETSAVDEWRASGLSLHVMRDHFSHDTEILGGLFGMRNTQQTFRLRAEAFRLMMENAHSSHSRGLDQYMLAYYVWPTFRGDMVSHDSYYCEKYPKTQPYPSCRLEGTARNFLGSSNNSTILSKPCPQACRAQLHQDCECC